MLIHVTRVKKKDKRRHYIHFQLPIFYLDIFFKPNK